MLKIIKKLKPINGRGRVLAQCPDCGKRWEVRSDYPQTVDRCKECDYTIRVGRNKKYEDTHTRHQYTKYRWRDEQRDMTIEFSYEEFGDEIHKSCHYCGKEFAGGMDRKLSHLGYTKDNSVPCCHICNRAKMDMEYQEFIDYLKRMSRLWA